MEVLNIEIYVRRNIGKNTTVVVENKYSYEIIKRVMDIILSLIGLIIAIPLMLIFGIAIKFESKGPVFYSQERVGKNGKVFMLYKLRSMYQNAEENGAKWAEKDDPRVTKIGRII